MSSSPSFLSNVLPPSSLTLPTPSYLTSSPSINSLNYSPQHSQTPSSSHLSHLSATPSLFTHTSLLQLLSSFQNSWLFSFRFLFILFFFKNSSFAFFYFMSTNFFFVFTFYFSPFINFHMSLFSGRFKTSLQILFFVSIHFLKISIPLCCSTLSTTRFYAALL